MTVPAPTWPSWRITRSQAVTSTRDSATLAAQQTGRSSCSPTKKLPAFTEWRSTRSRFHLKPVKRTPDATCFSPLVRPSRAPETATRPRLRFSRRQRSLAASAGHASSLGQQRATAAASRQGPRRSRLVPLLEDALLALAGSDDELRVTLLACLSIALRDEPSRARRDQLSEEAVVLARRRGKAIALALALDARIFAIIAPDTIGECLGLAVELCEVATRIGDEERIVQARMDALTTHLILGNVEQATADLAIATASAQRLQQPAQLWQTRSAAAMLALAAGKLVEAEDLIENAFAAGSRTMPAASSVRAFQRYTLAELQGSVEHAEQGLLQAANRYPARPVFRCALIHLHAQTGRSEDARRGLHDLARDEFSVVPLTWNGCWQ